MIKFFSSLDLDFVDRLYCNIAAATLGAGALGAVGSIFGSSKAADAQKAAAEASIANTRAMYESNKNLLSPFITGGQESMGTLKNWTDPTSSTNPLASLIKLVTPGADMSATLAQTPGYQFAQGQGNRAAMNALAARGLGGSPGAVAKGVADYTTGLASNTWGSVVDKLMGLFGTETNALQGLVTTGVNAGGALTGAGTAASGQIGSALTGMGNAQAAGYNAIGSAAGGFGNSLTMAALIKQLTGGGGGGGGGGAGIYGAPAWSDYNMTGLQGA